MREVFFSTDILEFVHLSYYVIIYENEEQKSNIYFGISVIHGYSAFSHQCFHIYTSLL